MAVSPETGQCGTISLLVRSVWEYEQSSMERIMKLPVALLRPSGFLPLTMSGAALLVVLTHTAIFGVAREPDEGAAAHLWQILMARQWDNCRS
jgi:hypothetical protein